MNVPQNSPTLAFENQAGGPGYGRLDAEGVSALVASGLKTALNVTAAAVIKVGAGRLARIIVIGGGTTSGAFTLNDAATIGGAATANELYTHAFGATAGTIINLDMPFVNGLVVSAVPGAGSPQLVIVYS